MGALTQAIIKQDTTKQQIQAAIESVYSNVKVVEITSKSIHIFFNDKNDERQMAVSFSNSCEIDNGIAGVWCSLGYWGNSLVILKYLCETFGGHLDENDSDEKDFYFINKK